MAKVVFLTMHPEVAYARRAMEIGAAGFVLKHSVASELITAVREALQGRTYVTPMIAGELLQSYREGNSGLRDSTQRLTARQREIVAATFKTERDAGRCDPQAGRRRHSQRHHFNVKNRLVHCEIHVKMRCAKRNATVVVLRMVSAPIVAHYPLVRWFALGSHTRP